MAFQELTLLLSITGYLLTCKLLAGVSNTTNFPQCEKPSLLPT